LGFKIDKGETIEMIDEFKFLTEDARKIKLPKESVDLVVTHTPYLGTDVERYGGDAKKQINVSFNQKKTLWNTIRAVQKMSRALKKSGSIFICVNDNFAFTCKFAAMVEKHTDLDVMGCSYWSFEDSNANKYEILNGKQAFWLHLTKEPNIYFKSDVEKRNWYIDGQTNLGETLDAELREMGHFALVDTYPIGIAHRFIQMFCPKEGVVFDPFGGSGVTAQAALENGCTFITNDVSPEQTKLAETRIEMYIDDPEKYGTLG